MPATRTLALLLCFVITATAQEVRSPQAAGTLKIFVLQGQNAMNSIPGLRAVDPVVEVRNENDQPVEGAEVTFELPTTGPGGAFGSGLGKHTAKTNLQGQAMARLVPNVLPGSFEIKVTAQLGDRIGHATITQTNSARLLEPGEKKQSRTFLRSWKFLAISGAAAAAIIGILVTRNDSASAATPTIVITPGGPVFGGPR